MAFIDSIFDWNGNNFKDGDIAVFDDKLKTVFDTIVSVVDNGN